MLGEEYGAVIAQGIADLALGEDLLLDPERSGLQEGTEARGYDSEMSFQDALELQQGLVLETDECHVADRDSDAFQSPGDGVLGKGRIAL